MYERMCSKQTGRLRERRHPPCHTLLHDSNPTSFAPFFTLWSWTLRIRWGNIYWEERSGSEGSVRRKGVEGAGSIHVCQQRHWPGATVAGSAIPSARFFDFCTILQLHRPSASLQKLTRITFLTKNNTEKIVVVVLKGWPRHPSIRHFLLSDYSFLK